MNNICFLVQIKRTNGVYEKGVVIKNEATIDAAINAAKQSYHAYFGAYGYGHDSNTDYVCCVIVLDDGSIIKNEIDDRRTNAEEQE